MILLTEAQAKALTKHGKNNSRLEPVETETPGVYALPVEVLDDPDYAVQAKMLRALSRNPQVRLATTLEGSFKPLPLTKREIDAAVVFRQEELTKITGVEVDSDVKPIEDVKLDQPEKPVSK
jgi:hypothetical protein